MEAIASPQRVVLDMDCTELPVCGQQENSAYIVYQAAGGTRARRVVAKVEFHAGELFPRVGFIVTSLDTDSRAAVRFYSRPGTAKQWITEGKQAVKMARLSRHRFLSLPAG